MYRKQPAQSLTRSTSAGRGYPLTHELCQWPCFPKITVEKHFQKKLIQIVLFYIILSQKILLLNLSNNKTDFLYYIFLVIFVLSLSVPTALQTQVPLCVVCYNQQPSIRLVFPYSCPSGHRPLPILLMTCVLSTGNSGCSCFPYLLSLKWNSSVRLPKFSSTQPSYPSFIIIVPPAPSPSVIASFLFYEVIMHIPAPVHSPTLFPIHGLLLPLSLLPLQT